MLEISAPEADARPSSVMVMAFDDGLSAEVMWATSTCAQHTSTVNNQLQQTVRSVQAANPSLSALLDIELCVVQVAAQGVTAAVCIKHH